MQCYIRISCPKPCNRRSTGIPIKHVLSKHEYWEEAGGKHRETLRARLGLSRAPERGVRERAATKAAWRGGPRPDMGLAAMPTRFSGIGGVPTSGATGSMP